MLCLTNPGPRVFAESWDLNPTRLTNPDAQPERERLRLLIIGSPEGVRSTIHILQVLNYVDQSRWSQLLKIPASGILITPNQGEVFSYLLRDRRLD